MYNEDDNDVCTHTETVYGREIRNPNYNREYWLSGDSDYSPSIFTEDEEVWTYKDINIHQYQCTQCKKVFNY